VFRDLSSAKVRLLSVAELRYATNRATSPDGEFSCVGLLAVEYRGSFTNRHHRAPQSSPIFDKSFKISGERRSRGEIFDQALIFDSAIDDPPRLVIDLPHARLDTREKRISVQATDQHLRADQFQQNPVARVVVDLLVPRAYTWAAPEIAGSAFGKESATPTKRHSSSSCRA